MSKAGLRSGERVGKSSNSADERNFTRPAFTPSRTNVAYCISQICFGFGNASRVLSEAHRRAVRITELSERKAEKRTEPNEAASQAMYNSVYAAMLCGSGARIEEKEQRGYHEGEEKASKIRYGGGEKGAT